MKDSNESVTAEAQSELLTTEPKIDVKFSAEELTERLMATASEAKKYRQEKALLKQQMEALSEELNSVKKTTLESQGNYKSLYEKLKEEHEGTQEKFKTQVGKYALNVIQSTVKEQLLSAKCQRPDAILKLCAERVRGFDLDDDFKPSPQDVKLLVEEAQKDYPEWFRQETPKLKDGFPMGKVPEKPINEMSKDQIMAALKALK